MLNVALCFLRIFKLVQNCCIPLLKSQLLIKDTIFLNIFFYIVIYYNLIAQICFYWEVLAVTSRSCIHVYCWLLDMKDVSPMSKTCHNNPLFWPNHNSKRLCQNTKYIYFIIVTKLFQSIWMLLLGLKLITDLAKLIVKQNGDSFSDSWHVCNSESDVKKFINSQK